LVSRTGIGITPGLEVLREFVEVTLLDRSEVRNDVEAILIDGGLGVGIESDALESSTESNGVSDSGHDELAKDLRKLETAGETREKVRKLWENYWRRRGAHRHFLRRKQWPRERNGNVDPTRREDNKCKSLTCVQMLQFVYFVQHLFCQDKT
jgi:hypothetical protein